MSNDRIVVGIDVGTTKICSLIAEVSDEDHLEVIGVGIVPSRGMKKGVIVNPDDVIESIVSAVQKAEQQSGFKIVSAFVGISGAHVTTQASQGVVAVRHPDRQITPDDANRAIEAARAVSVANDREIVQMLPRHYVVDGQDGIKNPIGMLGHRIEVQATIVSGSTTSVQNLVRCVERAGIGIDSLVLQPVAAGEAVLTEAEREIGVTLIDLGSGTTDVGVFVEGALVYATILPVGGFQVSNDLAVGLRTPFAAAEEIKVRHGYALPDLLEDDRTIDVSSFDSGDGRPVSQAAGQRDHRAPTRRDIRSGHRKPRARWLARAAGRGGAVRRDRATGRHSTPGRRSLSSTRARRIADGHVWSDRSDLDTRFRHECRPAQMGVGAGI